MTSDELHHVVNMRQTRLSAVHRMRDSAKHVQFILQCTAADTEDKFSDEYEPSRFPHAAASSTGRLIGGECCDPRA